jgi:MFS family permease
MTELPSPGRHDPYLAFRQPSFRRYLIGHVLAVLGQGMMFVAVGWELYDRTHSAFALGAVGAAQVIPLVLLVLPAGHVVDSYDRRRIVIAAEVAIALAAIGLAAASFTRAPVAIYYGLLFLYGAARTFQLPARQALMPNLVPLPAFTNAVAWNSGGWQAADVIGPALGGWMLAWTQSAGTVYLVTAATALVFATELGRVTVIGGVPRDKRPITVHALLEGARFVRNSPVLLAAMSLDLFAVLLGGVVALLPIFARDILHVGPGGLGWLRAAQSLGAVGMSVALAHRPPFRRAGPTLLAAVFGFGIATIVFGFSTSFLLSFVMLALAGMFDAVSVVVRLALAQLKTPDELRGRVSAVNSLFIGTSNELGEFESGVVAGLWGPVFAVVAGGAGVMVVVLLVVAKWPELLRLGRLTDGLVPVSAGAVPPDLSSKEAT